jgi:hypothetical protein
MLDPAALPNHPHDAYAAIRAEATRLAGQPDDFARRVALHYGLYVDSGGNHTFPLLALHGVLWASRFFASTGRIGDALRARYFYSVRERTYRMGMLHGFSEGFKFVNRGVFVDTFTNYHYTKLFGDHPAAGELLHPDLFAALTEMHAAAASGSSLSPERKRHVFLQSLQYEQEITVAPGVQDEIAKFDCPILTFLCLKPVVRFAYFPRRTYLFFRDFADKSERVAKALRSYDLADRAGWSEVSSSIREYGVLPDAFFADSLGYGRQLAESA